jgi:DNA-binding LacI/PurR family transcriptional regulator
MKHITIQDVADFAEVSKATVSRVLNGNPTVDETLRLRVVSAIQTLGYHPNRSAQRLRLNTSSVLGLIISDIQNPFFTSVVRGVEDAAYDAQMSIVLCNSDEDPDKQTMYLEVLRSERVGGLIITPASSQDLDLLSQFHDANVPIVLLDRWVEGEDFDAVTVDNVSGAYNAVKHLIDLGYHRIAIVSGMSHLTTGKERYEGYRMALEEAGIPIDSDLVKIGNFKTDSGDQLTSDLLDMNPPPEAIFTANNLMTLGALEAIHRRGLRIPQDIALVSFDDMPWAGALSPRLTAVSQPTYELGQQAVRLLLRRLELPTAEPEHVTLPTNLLIRESCGAALQKRPKGS